MVDRNEAAIDFTGKMLFYLFECSVRMFFDKVIELREFNASESRLATLILWVCGDAALYFPSLPELLYPPSCNLKLLCDLLESILAVIISSQNTFS